MCIYKQNKTIVCSETDATDHCDSSCTVNSDSTGLLLHISLVDSWEDEADTGTKDHKLTVYRLYMISDTRD